MQTLKIPQFLHIKNLHPHYFSIRNIPNLTPKLLNLFTSHKHMRIANKKLLTVSSLYTETKTPHNTLKKVDVVYGISCSDYQSVHISQNSKNLTGRTIFRKSHCLNRVSSRLSEYCIKTGYSINYDEILLTKNSNTNVSLRNGLYPKNVNNLNKRS